MQYLYYAGATILLALLDYIRIRQQAGKVQNINHAWSVIFAVMAAAIIWILSSHPYQWASLLFIPGFIAIREMFYDIALNLFRGLKWNYTSATTSAESDHWFSGMSFLAVKLIATGVLAVTFIINYVFIK